MKLEHFSHKHPLSLTQVKAQLQKNKYEGRKLICYGCLESISSEDFVYFCTQCECEGIDFFLHKSCAELPMEISHPKHQNHSLILHQRPLYLSGGCGCNVCRRTGWDGFTYNCSLCEFDADIHCVLRDVALLSTVMDRDLKHKSHKHPLILEPRPALFFCNACGEEDKDQSYSCTTASCPFWIHRTCALLPEIKGSKHHDHPLFLEYSFPLEYRHLGLKCEVCRKKFYLGYWLYSCTPCRYFVHVKCADIDTALVKNADTASTSKETTSSSFPEEMMQMMDGMRPTLEQGFASLHQRMDYMRQRFDNADLHVGWIESNLSTCFQQMHFSHTPLPPTFGACSSHSFPADAPQ